MKSVSDKSHVQSCRLVVECPMRPTASRLAPADRVFWLAVKSSASSGLQDFLVQHRILNRNLLSEPQLLHDLSSSVLCHSHHCFHGPTALSCMGYAMYQCCSLPSVRLLWLCASHASTADTLGDLTGAESGPSEMPLPAKVTQVTGREDDAPEGETACSSTAVKLSW